MEFQIKTLFKVEIKKQGVIEVLSVLMFIFTIIGGAIASFRYAAIYSFCIYQAIYFFNPEKRWWGKLIPDISYSYFIVLLMFGLYAIHFKKLNINKLTAVAPLMWAYMLGFLYLIAYSYAIFPDDHYRFLVYFIKLLIIISIAYKLVNSISDFDKVLYGFIFGAWYISFYVYQIGRNSGNRVEGVGLVDSPDSNGLAAAIAPCIVLCLYFYWTKQNKIQKYAFAFAGVFIANAIVLINSRGAFLGVAVSIMFFMYYMFTSSFQRKYQKLTAVFITIAGLSGGLYLADDDFINRITGIADEAQISSEKETGGTRMIFWQAAWDMTKDHPYGNGYRGFNAYSPFYIPKGVDTGGNRSRSVHSTWFETLTEVGYFGLFCLVMMLYSSLKCLHICRKKMKAMNNVDEYFKMIALQGALIAFIISMTFLNRMRAEILYWLVMISAMAYNVYVLKDQNNNKELDVEK
jgi:hypothetical protein